ncbi:NmrA family transcriptional regulator [Subtercola boreus]|uniref:NmrA family transcriptional regulator n=1 Tax=Subtercola boreus TaxID=120213 RepID=A0A3E0VQW5_9MICO|nr:NAD(P)H-binding protein [Subtercola boreus]RFA12372.1 NmrA family transcriptional regulator [Subtercola boreus]
MTSPTKPQTFLVFGATGQTGQHFTSLALQAGHRVRALARTPSKLTIEHPDLEVIRGSVSDTAGGVDLDDLVRGTDIVVSMLGDVEQQREQKVNTEFVRRLVPAMRRNGVKRFLYQAGGLSRAPGRPLSPALWAIRKTLARGYDGQHRDNEAVMEYLTNEAPDIEWMVHRAGIGSNGASKGVLERSTRRPSIGTFRDCAAYNLRTVMDAAAIHTSDFSMYRTA